MNNNIERPKNVKRIEGLSHRAVSGDFLNADICRGRKDGKRAPDAWSAALQAIEADEQRLKNDARSAIRQKQGEADAHLEHIGNLLEQNKVMREALKNEGRLLTEPVAAAQYASAFRDITIVIFLTLLDAAGMVFIAKKIFGGNVLYYSPIGILLAAGVIFLIKSILEYLSPEERGTVGKIIRYLGGALILIGTTGFALLRSVTFDASLSGDGAINTTTISLGDLLMTIGIGIGLPLILGVLYEEESLKLKAAKIALNPYGEERELWRAKTEWTAHSKRLQEIDDHIDGITANTIKLRQSRYVRGYIKGVRKNPDAKHYIDAILKRGHTASPERPLTLEPVGIGGN